MVTNLVALRSVLRVCRHLATSVGTNLLLGMLFLSQLLLLFLLLLSLVPVVEGERSRGLVRLVLLGRSRLLLLLLLLFEAV